ncbi:MAG: 2-oxoglutarate ferredoxin oxidoreductase subunit alpha, partial [Rhodobacterales bacterium]|nr:2-oxoglutarate ferredoxin oxidoreductase subunit alpha [Rhodobacterales bacterium]
MNRAAPETVDQVVIRFAGDSGDGMQLLGSQFTLTTALAGNDIATFPDFPAEIRAPAGTRAGVSGFQLHFANSDIFTPGDETDVLVAMNPAALITNLNSVKPRGLVIVNTDKFKRGDLAKANCETNPLEDGSLDGFRVLKAGISSLTRDAVKPHGLNTKESDRCKNLFALGMMYWLYERDMGNTIRWIESKFKSPYKEANITALHAGHAYAETVEVFQTTYVVPAADLPSGTYRNITGNACTAIGLAVAANLAERTLSYGSYPITPATDILHALAPFKNYGVVTFQAEDEIAGVCSAIGASWGGAIGVTGTSGPGLALKGEAIGLAIITELPLVVINVQRGGPSTGLPTKTEQSDLLMAMYGRNGESPMIILAPQSPSDCFDIAIEAIRLTQKYMTPVMILSDGY